MAKELQALVGYLDDGEWRMVVIPLLPLNEVQAVLIQSQIERLDATDSEPENHQLDYIQRLRAAIPLLFGVKIKASTQVQCELAIVDV